MKCAVILALALAIVAQAAVLPNFTQYKGNRIVGGEEAADGQFPWQAGVYYRRDDGTLYFCGGALVSKSYVLTAAHCAVNAVSYQIFLGSARLNSGSGESIDVDGDAAIVNPDFNEVTLNHDLALIRLPEPVEFSENLSPIRLPERREEAPDGGDLVVSGWGVTENSETLVSDLVYATVTVISNEECAAIYGSNVVIDAVLCAVGSDNQGPCNGDGGAPLVLESGSQPTLHGIVSFQHRDGCDSGNPTGYVRIEKEVSWIYDILGEDLC